MVVLQSLRPVSLGIALGLCGAAVCARLVTALLYRVTATDLATYICVTTALILTGVLATCVPPWRAVKADPLNALRHE